MEEKFPAQNYKENVLADCFEDSKKYFLDAFVAIDFAHCVMLGEKGVITSSETRELLGALRRLDRDKISATEYDGSFEDLFFLIQREIASLCDPDVAARLHTARSRNDIDVTLYRYYLRPATLRLIAETMQLHKVLLDLAAQHHDTLMPAYTHTQPAQPTTLAHYLLAMAENVGRDVRRLRRAYENMNFCPLGSGAITTSGFPIDRHRVAELLGFAAPTVNSYASIASVDYFTELIGATSAAVVNVGRFAQEFMLMAMIEFDVIRLPDGYVQGSSIMPQKRNPVALEHVRALASKSLGQSLGVMTSVHNTPFGDINDVEDDLQPLIYSAIRDATRSISLLGAALKSATFKLETLARRAEESFITVTELADTLVRTENLSFGVAHKICGVCVRAALASAGGQITHEILQNACREVLGREIEMTAERLREVISAANFVSVRTVYGGPAPSETKRAVSAERVSEQENIDWYENATTRLDSAKTLLQKEVESLSAA